MPDQFDYDVFISDSSQDREWVRGPLLNGVEEGGLRAFIDFRDFQPGAPSIKEMERGVTTCRKTLVVLTPHYIKSGWCELESIMLQGEVGGEVGHPHELGAVGWVSAFWEGSGRGRAGDRGCSVGGWWSFGGSLGV